MSDVTNTATIIFKGEIYNYRELRAELIRAGYRFRSDSDTEVLLNLYLRDGDKMMEKLHGIFVFAIYDHRDSSMLVVRDGIGVKPLYYAETPKGVIFASEIKALLQESSIDRTLDQETVWHHLVYLWSPSPLTMLEGVKKLVKVDAHEGLEREPLLCDGGLHGGRHQSPDRHVEPGRKRGRGAHR